MSGIIRGTRWRLLLAFAVIATWGAFILVDSERNAELGAIAAQIINTSPVTATNGKYPSDSGPSWVKYGTKTDTTVLTLANAPGAGLSVYLYEAYCVDVHASTVGVALIKYGSTAVAAVSCNPAGKATEPTVFRPPLKFPPNRAVTINSVGSVTTMHFTGMGTVAR